MLKRFFLASTFVVAGIALTASAAPAAMVSNHPVSPVRTPGGRVVRGPHDSLVSSNWSGYVVAKYATGQSYTSASSTWTVPAAAVPPGQTSGYSSSWVGIGGFCENARCTRSDRTLIQLGTEQDNINGTPGYYAWYEMLPAAETPIPSSALPVNPGDTITASLTLLPAAGTVHSGKNGKTSTPSSWLLTMTNVTQNISWSTTVTYSSSLASAEWIEEAPWNGGILPLADYTTAIFDPGTVNGGQNPALVSSDAVIMQNSNGQTSNPSAPDADTDGFGTCWGNGSTFTACATPSS
ncbi:MAG TPA: G1 family glutamic endopeptidase [Candidatus Paceibacterota bacterium]|nr:G1 family glutamic endopeptidase [Candidatus Paceibacterota bacterium]